MQTRTNKDWNGHTGPVLEGSDQYDVIDCDPCGFAHVVPIPSEAELVHLYTRDYYGKEKPQYIDEHLQDREWWKLAYGDRYDTFESELPPDRRRILDVGSGPGLFLLLGADRGWDAVGCEPAEQAATHARSLGANVIQAFLTDEVADSVGKFDVVHLSEVLEHIRDPEAMVRRVRRLLPAGGIVCIVVPNDFNPFQRALRDVAGYRPWWIAPPHHVNYFNFESLASLVERCGFETIRREATFPMELFLLMGANYVGNDVTGRECHTSRIRFEQTLADAGLNALRRSIYHDLARVGIGREVLLFARAVG